MRTVTLEEHVSTLAFLEAVDSRSQRGLANEYIRSLREKLVDLGAKRLADMDAARIDVQVLSLAGGDMDRLDSATATTLARLFVSSSRSSPCLHAIGEATTLACYSRARLIS